MLYALLLSAALAAPAAAPAAKVPVAAPATKAPASREARIIDLDARTSTLVHTVKVSVGTLVEFPADFARAPTCGDCGDRGLFRMDPFRESRYISLKPRRLPGRQADGTDLSTAEMVTIVQVALAGDAGYTLAIQVQYEPDPEKSDQRVIFRLPGEVRSELHAARSKLEAEFAGKVERKVTEAFIQAFAEPHSCASLSGHVRQDDIIVSAREVCTFGRRVFVRGTVENRARNPFDVAEVSLKVSLGKDLVAPGEVQQYVDEPHVEFQRTSTFVLGFALAEGAPSPRRFDLVVAENGGKGRVIGLARVEP